MSTVGVLGTGRMGSAMARALAREGHALVLWNRSPAAARSLAEELGSDVARVAGTPADTVAATEVALTMLADRAAVDAVYHQPDGVLAGVHDGTLLLEMSTAEPACVLGLEPEVRRRGGALLDAPVSGSIATATSGQLTIMVGGDAADVERATPVLDAMSTRVFHMGPVGTAAAMKLAVNAVIFGLDVAVSEALVLAERAGVERHHAYDVLEASAAGAPLVGYKRASFLHPETTPTAFSLDLAAKDLGLITDLAATVGAPVAQARTNLDLIRRAAGTQGGDRDFALVAEHLRASASGGQ